MREAVLHFVLPWPMFFSFVLRCQVCRYFANVASKLLVIDVLTEE